MNYILTIALGAGFFLGVTTLWWGVMRGIEWFADRRSHYCTDALTWCEQCMDTKQRVWFNYLKEEAR